MTSKKKLLMVRVTARDARTMRALLGDHTLDVTCGGPQGIADGGVVFNAQIEAVAEALDRVEQTGERIWEAELHRLKGRLIRDQVQASPAPGIPAKAEECFRTGSPRDSSRPTSKRRAPYRENSHRGDDREDLAGWRAARGSRRRSRKRRAPLDPLVVRILDDS